MADGVLIFGARASVAVLALALAVLPVAGCGPEPKVEEDFPESRPWFSVESVEFDDGGVVTVEGSLLGEARESLSGEEGSREPYPEHVAYGFWPDPTQVGPGDVVDVDERGGFEFTHDFSRPGGLQAGWHVLQFDKAGWGTQILWLNLEKEEWTEAEP